jgi:hypothetical protein
MILCGLCLPLLAAAQLDSVKFGVNDKVAGEAIRRANRISALKAMGKHQEVAAILQSDLRAFPTNSYAIVRIKNELADIYSYLFLDIEKAIAIDSEIVKLEIPLSDPVGNFAPRYRVASQNSISDLDYVATYIEAKPSAIIENAESRLSKNKELLTGVIAKKASTYSRSFLTDHLTTVKRDILSTTENTPARYSMVSRLIRAEYELRQADPSFEPVEYVRLIEGAMGLTAVDLSEISFLQLSEYLITVYKRSGDKRFAEMALDTLYRPYMRLADISSRFQYNKLINDYISILIDENYQRGVFDEMLYYVSLNKSRLLLEEGVAFNAAGSGTVNIADLTARDGIPRTSSGLPEKEWFKKRLAAAGDYLDFYVGGKFGAQSTNPAQKVSVADRSTMPLNVRDFGVESNTEAADNFDDDSLYLTQISGGKIVSTKRIAGSQLKELKGQLNDAYLKVSDGKLGVAPPVPFFQSLRRDAHFPATLRVSPDKWMAKHPLDYHLGTNITRAVNLFTANESDSIQSISVGGFFNPTTNGKPLPGSEQEAAVIKGIFPASQLYVRDAANISTLKSMAMPTVLHLSMHGQFNAENPRSSRLAFAGAIAGTGVVIDDPNSLYAKDMAAYSVLRDRDLIFAAACQTGLSAADQANENELTGILRPLTANRNKNIILSLWKVDDEATRDFVSAFYQRLAATRDVRVSFHHAQSEVRDKYKLPYYWAAFYLSQTR